MKKQKLAMAIGVAALAMSSGMAHAQNNVITFNGEVVEQTCDPVVDNGNYTVVLDQVAVGSLTTGGMHTDISTPFVIQVKDCPSGVSVGATLASSTYDVASGNLTNATGDYGSDAVQIQVMDGTDATKQVRVGAAEPVTFIPTVNGAASIPMTAYYYVKDPDAVEAGTIVTTATYALRTQ